MILQNVTWLLRFSDDVLLIAPKYEDFQKMIFDVHEVSIHITFDSYDVKKDLTQTKLISNTNDVLIINKENQTVEISR